MKTTFTLKNELKDFTTEMEAKRAAIVEAATNNEAETVAKLEGEIRSLETCRNAIKAELEQREATAAQQEVVVGATPEERTSAAYADLIRSAVKGREVAAETRSALGITGTKNSGENFLPTTLANTLVSEPMEKNQLRQVVPVSNIKGLELPKIAYRLDNDDFITDEGTAKELEITGDKLSFGRNKFKVFAAVSDSVMHCSDLELTSYVNNALRAGLSAKEKKVLLAKTPIIAGGSLYDTGIKEVEGADLYTAITEAVADLHEDYRENATIVMAYKDYLKVIKTLANGNATLYGVQPEQILGKPVVFCDAATTPIVGDFSFIRINYDGEFIYDTDKDVKTGDYLFVVTAWFDIKLILKSAFRRVKVAAPVAETRAKK